MALSQARASSSLSRLTIRSRPKAAITADAPRPPQSPGHSIPTVVVPTASVLFAKVVVTVLREGINVGGGDAGGLLETAVTEREVAGRGLYATRQWR